MRMLGIVLLITEPSLQPHNLGTLGETLQEDCEVRNCCPPQVPIPNPPLCPAFAPRVGSATLPSVITLMGSSLHLNVATPTFPCVPSVLATVLSSQRAQALLPASQPPSIPLVFPSSTATVPVTYAKPDFRKMVWPLSITMVVMGSLLLTSSRPSPASLPHTLSHLCSVLLKLYAGQLCVPCAP